MRKKGWVSSGWCLAALSIGIGLPTGVVEAAQVNQNFDSEPADWVGFNNKTGLNNFGWSNTDNVGLGAGEAGGALARDGGTPDFGYYATAIGSLDPSTDALSFSGTLSFEAPQLDYFMIGFFNAADGVNVEYYPNTFMGFYSDDRFARAMHFAGGSGAGAPPFLGSPSQFAIATSHAFELSYDPNGSGGVGRITGQLGGQAFAVDLPAGKKDLFNNFTHFGITTRNNHGNGAVTGRATPTFVDNLSYTSNRVIPEPASVTMALAAVLFAALYGSRGGRASA
jgi:hypothetical protein